MSGLGDPSGTRLVPMTREQRDSLGRELEHPCPVGCHICANAFLVRKEVSDRWDAATDYQIDIAAEALYDNDDPHTSYRNRAIAMFAALGCVVERPANTGDHQ